jgi:hypothetical protein
MDVRRAGVMSAGRGIVWQGDGGDDIGGFEEDSRRM